MAAVIVKIICILSWNAPASRSNSHAEASFRVWKDESSAVMRIYRRMKNFRHVHRVSEFSRKAQRAPQGARIAVPKIRIAVLMCFRLGSTVSWVCNNFRRGDYLSRSCQDRSLSDLLHSIRDRHGRTFSCTQQITKVSIEWHVSPPSPET